MAFLTDVTKLKDDLILFRRGDVQHGKWYCRMKLPGVDRYKTIALKIESLRDAQDKAFEHYADFRFRLKHNVPSLAASELLTATRAENYPTPCQCENCYSSTLH